MNRQWRLPGRDWPTAPGGGQVSTFPCLGLVSYFQARPSVRIQSSIGLLAYQTSMLCRLTYSVSITAVHLVQPSLLFYAWLEKKCQIIKYGLYFQEKKREKKKFIYKCIMICTGSWGSNIIIIYNSRVARNTFWFLYLK